MKKLIIVLFSMINIISFSNVNYNVFIDFDDKTTANVSKISHALKGVGIDSLYSQGYKVHLTLYLSEYKEGRYTLNKLKKVVDKLAKETHSFKYTFYRIHDTSFMNDYSGWLMLDGVKSKEIRTLADKAANMLIPLRATDAKIPDWAKNIPAKAEGFKKYGSPNVYENFDPHITLTVGSKYDKFNLSQLFRNYPFEPFNAKVKGIGIMEVNSLGQGKQVIYYKEFK